MARYECSVCGFIYDEEKQGKKWEELADDWVCPGCDSDKTYFKRLEQAEEPAAPPAAKKRKMTKQMICSVCGYIINETYKGDVCPACGAAKTAFQPYPDKMSPHRRKILNLHIHNILVHFPQAFSFLMLFLIFMTLFLKGRFQFEFMITFKILSFFLPLSVVASMISGMIDGKNRFKRINTPILKRKIIMASLFFIFSINVMLALTVFNMNLSWLQRLLIVLTGFCALCSLFLGYNGGRLSGKEVPG